jgi:4-hydroxybenzoate polyprenyltransferase/uncharacterized protein YndB with AHSA1/START domain
MLSDTEIAEGAPPVSEVRATEKASFLSLPPEEMVDSVRRGASLSTGKLERARLVIMLGRPRTCVPGLVAYALGYSYTEGGRPWRMLLGALLAVSIGFSANLHNTATDLHEDSHNLPGRVFLLAQLGYRQLIAICRVIGALMLAGACALGWHFAVFMGLAVVGLHQYSAPPIRSKGRPFLGLWVFAQAVVFPFLFGWTTEPGRMLSTLVFAVATPFGGHREPAAATHQSFRYLGMWAFLTLWFMAKGTFKNVPDFDGDRAAGVRTSATVWSTRRVAALVATAATLLAYLSLSGLVALGLEKPRVLLSLVWLGPVAWNCVRLARANHGVPGNRILRADMLVSTGFIVTLLLLVAPGTTSLVVCAAGALVLFGSDLMGLDSRREGHVPAAHTAAGSAEHAAIRTRARIPFPPELVFAACRDDVAALRRYLPGIRSISVRSREERDGKVEFVVDWCAGGGVPGPLRALMGKSAFEWTDYATWDSSTLSVAWRTETRALGGALSCGARDWFTDDGEGGTLLEVRGALEVDGTRIPGVPSLLRAAVARRLESHFVARVDASVARTAKALTAYLIDRARESPAA